MSNQYSAQWQQERIERILGLLRRGYTQSQVVAETGISHTAITRYLNRLREQGEEIPDYNGKRVRVRKERTLELLNKRYTRRQIGLALGINMRTVDKYIREMKDDGTLPDTPRVFRLSQETLDRAKEMLEDGASYREVARTLGIDPTNLSKRIPGYQMSPTESGALGPLAVKLNRLSLVL